mgnify:CR=1 FL=1
MRLLREDEEFRYAVAGLLGLEEILRRLDRNEQELIRLREDLHRFMMEQEKRWEENNKRWEEAYKRFEAIENELKKLREDFNRFVELEEKRWAEANKRFSRIELELGALTEATLSRYVWEDLREEIRSRGEEILNRYRNLVLDGEEIDLVIETSRSVYIVEVKTKPDIEDIRDLIDKADIASKKFNKPVTSIIAGVYIGDEVRIFAERKNIVVYSY